MPELERETEGLSHVCGLWVGRPRAEAEFTDTVYTGSLTCRP